MDKCPGYYGPVLVLAVGLFIQNACALQCYSCKSSGSNELEANIRCLENAYLEQCEEFYQYYEEVENGDLPDVTDYYYDDYYGDHSAYPAYDEGGQPIYADDAEYDEELNQLEASLSRKNTSPAKASKSRPKRAKKEKNNEATLTEEEYDEYYNQRKKEKKEKKPKRERGKKEKKKPKKMEDEEYDEYYYDYYDAKNESKSGGNMHGKARPEDEHYCYSMTSKGSWESYTVEKGCKKIKYCKASLDGKPEWMHPWNFCCDRSRCNVKLVKDKPQRVYGMGCRRTDDCIQGHNGRPVCPHFFKSCPRAYHGLVKMECRSQARTMASVKTGAKYRHLYRDKKCYCGKGYYPKGPICTSAGTSTLSASAAQVLLMTLPVFFLGSRHQ